MDFTLTDEHRMLHDMVDRLGADRFGLEARRAAIRDGNGFLRSLWTEMGELGLLGAPLPESCGGLGAGSVATMMIMSALGRRLVISPFVPSIVCCAGLIARAGTGEQQAEWLPPLIGGRQVMAFACSEQGAEFRLDDLHCQAHPTADGFELSGGKSLVIGAAWSQQLLVVARLAGDAGALGAFVMPLDTPGLEARHRRMIDGGSAAEIRLHGVRVSASARVGSGGDLRPHIEQVQDEAIAALCADATGSMKALLDATTEYARTRRQFGKPIGSFQALQHRMVDMLVACEQATSISHRAALGMGGSAAQRRRAASAAKALVGKAGRMVAQAAVQIHGGIGTTDEIDVSHHFRRIEVFNLQLGSVDQHLERYAALGAA